MSNSITTTLDTRIIDKVDFESFERILKNFKRKQKFPIESKEFFAQKNRKIINSTLNFYRVYYNQKNRKKLINLILSKVCYKFERACIQVKPHGFPIWKSINAWREKHFSDLKLLYIQDGVEVYENNIGIVLKLPSQGCDWDKTNTHYIIFTNPVGKAPTSQEERGGSGSQRDRYCNFYLS
jgi:hypothetical protein